MNRKKTLIISSVLFIIVVATLFVSYGYITVEISGNETSKKTVFNGQMIKVEYSDGTETLKSNQGAFTPGSTITKTFTLTNTGNVSVKYSINLDNVTNTFQRKNDLTYELSINDVVLKNGIYETKGIFPNSKLTILNKDVLGVGDSKTYTLKINYLNSEDNQIIDSGAILNGKIVIEESKTSINKLIVYGNSVQNGIPTSEEPIEIESVGSKLNIADLSKTKTSTTTPHVRFNYDNITGTIEYTNTPTTYDYLILYLERDVGFKFEVGKTYYWGADITVSEKQTSDITTVFFGVNWTDCSNSGRTFKVTENKTFRASGSFTYDGTQETIRLLMHANYGSIEPAKVKFENIYVSEVNEFEPYGKYKVPLSVSGKNLMNNSNNVKGSLLITDGSINSNIGYVTTSDFIALKAGTYTISYKNGAKLRYIALYNKNKEIVGNFWSNRANPYTFTLDDDYLVRIDIERDENVAIENFSTFFTEYEVQLEKGSKATKYIPYIQSETLNIFLDEPLRKVGDFKDYIDFKSSKIFRNVQVIDDTGTLALEQSYNGVTDDTGTEIVLPKIIINDKTNIIEVCSNNGICASNIEVEYDE